MAGALAHRGPDELGVYRDAARASRTRGCRSSTSSSGQQPLANEAARLWIVVQRRDLQLRRAARRAGGARPPLPHPQRHRGDRPRLRGLGRARLRALQRPVGDRASGTRSARRLVLARDRTRRPPALLLRARRPALLRQRGEGASSRPIRRSRAPSIPSASTRRSRSGRWCRRRPCFGESASSSPGTSAVTKRGGVRETRVLEAALSHAPVRRRSVHRLARRRRRGGAQRARRRDVACACCAPTCRSAATSPAASTARSSRRSGAQVAGERFQTFSLRFEDAEYDETDFQRLMARGLGSEHHEVVVSRSDIARGLPRRDLRTPSARSCAPRRRRCSCSRGWCARRASRWC